MKRPSLPARVVDAKKNMNFPSLLKSTGCESELELKELLIKNEEELRRETYASIYSVRDSQCYPLSL